MVAQGRAAIPRRVGFLAACIVMAYVACSLGALGCLRSPDPARLMVREPALHLAEGVPGEALSGSFVLRNHGGEVLQITKLEADCGCSYLEVSETLCHGQSTVADGKVKVDHAETPYRASTGIHSY